MARAIWSGSISFGLVNIPVKLFTAVRDRDIHFHMMSKDGRCRLRRKLVCPDTGEEFNFDDTAKGVEIAPDQYVIVRETELEKLRPDSGRTVDITEFVDLDQIDPILFDRPYYMVPEERGAKPYRLLLEALTASNKVAIARFVMRTKEYLAAIRPIGDALCLETMRFIDEVVPVDDLTGIPERIKVSGRELEMADMLIESLTTKFKPEKYRDEYRTSVRELVERKAEGETIVAQGTTVSDKAPGKVIDLMEALRRSLKQTKEEREPDRPKRSPSSSKRAGSRHSTSGKSSSKSTSKKRSSSSKAKSAAKSASAKSRRRAA